LATVRQAATMLREAGPTEKGVADIVVTSWPIGRSYTAARHCRIAQKLPDADDAKLLGRIAYPIQLASLSSREVPVTNLGPCDPPNL